MVFLAQLSELFHIMSLSSVFHLDLWSPLYFRWEILIKIKPQKQKKRTQKPPFPCVVLPCRCDCSPCQWHLASCAIYCCVYTGSFVTPAARQNESERVLMACGRDRESWLPTGFVLSWTCTVMLPQALVPKIFFEEESLKRLLLFNLLNSDYLELLLEGTLGKQTNKQKQTQKNTYYLVGQHEPKQISNVSVVWEAKGWLKQSSSVPFPDKVLCALVDIYNIYQ